MNTILSNLGSARAEGFVQIGHSVLNTLLLSPQFICCIHSSLDKLLSQKVIRAKAEKHKSIFHLKTKP